MKDPIRDVRQTSDTLAHPISGTDCRYSATWSRSGRILQYCAAVDIPDRSRPPIWYGAIVIDGTEELPEDELAIGFAESLVLAALIDEELRWPRASRFAQIPFNPTPPPFERVIRDAKTIGHAVQLASICFPVLSFPSSGVPGWKSLTRRGFDHWGSAPDVQVALRAAAHKFIKVMGSCASDKSHGGTLRDRSALDDAAAVATFRVIYALSWFGLSEEARHVLQQMSLISKITGRWSTTDILSWRKALFYLGCEEEHRLVGAHNALQNP